MTKLRFLRRCSIVVFLYAAVSPLVAEEEELLLQPRGSTARNAYYEVLADDMLSARYAATVGEMLASRFSRMLPPPGRASQPVLVDLVPEGEFGQPGSFVTRIYRSGQVQVSISWGPATTREMLERALAQGHLTYLSGAYAAGTVTVPLWLELAVQHLSRAQAVPSHGRFLAMEAARERPMRVQRILSAERADRIDDELAPYAYWLLTFLDREGRSRGQLQNFLIRLLKGEEPLGALNAAFGENLRSVQEAELWWLVGLTDLVRPASAPMLTVAESRRRVKELSRFAFEGVEGESRIFVEDLWERRASATLQDELRRRRQVAALEISLVHPFYHNAFLSLDRVYAAILSANEEEAREAVLAWHHDLRAGDELALDTSAVLDDLSAELRK